MRLIIALFAALALGAVASPAMADDFDYQPVEGFYQGANFAPLNDGRVNQLERMAHGWWGTMGRRSIQQSNGTPCNRFSVWVGDLPSRMNASAPQPGCFIVISRRLMYSVRPIKDPGVMYNRLIELCSVVAHEVGHTTGLGHSDHGVMVPEDFDIKELPPYCLNWVAWQLGAKRMATLRREAGVKSNWALYRFVAGLNISS